MWPPPPKASLLEVSWSKPLIKADTTIKLNLFILKQINKYKDLKVELLKELSPITGLLIMYIIAFSYYLQEKKYIKRTVNYSHSTFIFD